MRGQCSQSAVDSRFRTGIKHLSLVPEAEFTVNGSAYVSPRQNVVSLLSLAAVTFQPRLERIPLIVLKWIGESKLEQCMEDLSVNTRTVLRFSRRFIWRRALLVPLAAVLAACGALGRRESEEQTPMTQGAADSQTSTAPAPTAQSTAQESTSTQSQTSTQPKDSTELPATPACDDDDEPTPPQTAGPFYTPNTPLRTSLLGAWYRRYAFAPSGSGALDPVHAHCGRAP